MWKVHLNGSRFLTSALWVLSTIILLGMEGSMPEEGFKQGQMRYPRVREAYSEKGDEIARIYENAGLSADCKILLKAYKLDRKLQVWGAASSNDAMVLLRTYDICALSGEAGPKSRQGDLQVPEGYYHIDRFNPSSSFHLSLGVDYPNDADRKRSTADNLGGDIFIHGACVTVGCLPMTDDKIKEIYALAVNARSAGQRHVPVHIYPADPAGPSWPSDGENSDLWENLKEIHDRINAKELQYRIEHDGNGGYRIGN